MGKGRGGREKRMLRRGKGGWAGPYRFLEGAGSVALWLVGTYEAVVWGGREGAEGRRRLGSRSREALRNGEAKA